MKKACISMATLMMVAFLSFGLVSCGDDDDPWTNAPDDDVRVDPDVPVPDPEGTLELSMSPGGNALDDEFYIDKNYNFRYYYHDAYYLDSNYGKNTMFTPLSTVNGLGNINYIPVVAWVDQVAAIKGRGYVAYSPRKDKFYRLYVEPDTISGSSSSRYIVRYQMPFLGTDEEIKLDEKAITFDAEESEQALLFNNENILVYTCESSESWCQVYKCSDMEYGFLNNGVMIHVLPSDRSEPRTATVTLTTAYGKETQISVTQAGMEPYIRINGNEEVSVIEEHQTISLGINTNYSIDDIEVTSDKYWCTGYLLDESEDMYVKATKVTSVKRTVESRGQEDYGSAKIYTLYIIVGQNVDEEERVATLTLKGKDGKTTATVSIRQGASKETMPDTLWYNRESTMYTQTVPSGGVEAISSEDWCKVILNGNQLIIRLTAATEERVATISFQGYSRELIVVQSKYAVGDKYEEGDATCTVGYMEGNQRYIYRYIYKNENISRAAWSTTNIEIGAKNQTDGKANMAIVKRIPDWKELFPAFALCDSLNTEGVEGWYLPAIYELNRLEGLRNNRHYWSSTEISDQTANLYYIYWGNIYSESKGNTHDVIAVRKF